VRNVKEKNKMKRYLSLMVLLVFGLTIFSTVKISVSIVPQRTFVEAVGKELVDVTVIIPPGYSPANYAPTAKQIIDFSDSTVYFTIGVPSESSNILPKLAKNAPNVQLVSLHDAVDKVFQPRYFSENERDPHIWLSAKRVMLMVGIIRDYLCSIDPDHDAYYRQNTQDFINKLNITDQLLNETLSSIENKGFFCFHPSFGYFADDYGLKMYALEENGKEASPKRIAEMVAFARENNYKVIFYQAEIDSSQTDSFAHEIGGKALKLDPLSADYINNLKSMGQIFLDVLGERDGE